MTVAGSRSTQRLKATIVSSFSTSRHLCDAIDPRPCRPAGARCMANRHASPAVDRISHHTPGRSELAVSSSGRSCERPGICPDFLQVGRAPSPRVRRRDGRRCQGRPRRVATRRILGGYKNVRDAVALTLMLHIDSCGVATFPGLPGGFPTKSRPIPDEVTHSSETTPHGTTGAGLAVRHSPDPVLLVGLCGCCHLAGGQYKQTPEHVLIEGGVVYG
jgi:hypothetical protein